MHRKKTYILIAVVFLMAAAAIALAIAATLTNNFKGTSHSNKGGKVSVKFVHTSSGKRDNIDPSYFGMKLLAVYLSEGIDGNGTNTGMTSMIYSNPDCNNDIGDCGILGDLFA
jgi:hypothetical protein